MAAVTIAWLLPPYLCWSGVLTCWPFNDSRGGPLGEALADTRQWPAALTLVFAVLGMAQPRRRLRWLSLVAIAIVCGAYATLLPGLWR